MKIQNRLVAIYEGLYFINHAYEKDLISIPKPQGEAEEEGSHQN
jgi:hypothetical protein